MRQCPSGKRATTPLGDDAGVMTWIELGVWPRGLAKLNSDDHRRRVPIKTAFAGLLDGILGSGRQGMIPDGGACSCCSTEEDR
jgi:hypothetical protein